jgi:hypothetical protein
MKCRTMLGVRKKARAQHSGNNTKTTLMYHASGLVRLCGVSCEYAPASSQGILLSCVSRVENLEGDLHLCRGI